MGRGRLGWGDEEGVSGEEEGKVEKSWQGPGVGKKGGGGRVDKKEWGGEGETGLGQWGGDWEGAMGRGRWRGGNLKGEMGSGATGRGRQKGGKEEGEKKGQEEEAFYRWIRFNVWVDIGYRIELQADSMPGATEVLAFTVSYKHM